MPKSAPDSRSTSLQDHHGGNPKIVRTEEKRWSEAAERRFLDRLAVTCNVMDAVEASGFSTTTAYYHRRHEPGFAARWREALEIGYERLEARLLETAERSLTGEPIDADSPLPKMSVAEAIQILQLWRRTVREGVQRSGGRPKPIPSLDEVRAGIVRKLEAIARARACS